MDLFYFTSEQREFRIEKRKIRNDWGGIENERSLNWENPENEEEKPKIMVF